ncbi:MAG: hypothetical protein SF162_12710 [bacterium]|nr:hypothetical protein [bacterium]
MSEKGQTMDGQVGWLVERRVILVTPGEQFSESDMRAGMEATAALIEQAQIPFHLVVDVSRLKTFTPHFADPIREIQQHRSHENYGWTLIITHNALMRFFGVIAAKILNDRFRPVGNMEEAIHFLTMLDPDLFAAPAAAQAARVE